MAKTTNYVVSYRVPGCAIQQSHSFYAKDLEQAKLKVAKDFAHSTSTVELIETWAEFRKRIAEEK